MNDHLMSYTINPIAFLRSPFKEKFGIPRQPGLIESVDAIIEFESPYNDPAAFEGLEEFSHLWVSFLFHKNISEQWKPKVRPPRLGGNKKLGVFSTRSSFRPNGIGLSLVKLKTIDTASGKARLIIDCPDILDGTPIVDIKPYLAYSDQATNSRSGFAPSPPTRDLHIEFSEKANKQLIDLHYKFPGLKELIAESLALDPRPAYKANTDQTQEYGIRLYDFDIKWSVTGRQVQVLEIKKIA